jgi:hypothetical protein
MCPWQSPRKYRQSIIITQQQPHFYTQKLPVSLSAIPVQKLKKGNRGNTFELNRNTFSTEKSPANAFCTTLNGNVNVCVCVQHPERKARAKVDESVSERSFSGEREKHHENVILFTRVSMKTNDYTNYIARLADGDFMERNDNKHFHLN